MNYLIQCYPCSEMYLVIHLCSISCSPCLICSSEYSWRCLIRTCVAVCALCCIYLQLVNEVSITISVVSEMDNSNSILLLFPLFPPFLSPFSYIPPFFPPSPSRPPSLRSSLQIMLIILHQYHEDLTQLLGGPHTLNLLWYPLIHRTFV